MRQHREPGLGYCRSRNEKYGESDLNSEHVPWMVELRHGDMKSRQGRQGNMPWRTPLTRRHKPVRRLQKRDLWMSGLEAASLHN